MRDYEFQRKMAKRVEARYDYKLQSAYFVFQLAL